MDSAAVFAAPRSVSPSHYDGRGHLQGYVRTTRDDLVRAFGVPLGSFTRYRDLVENWFLEFADGVMVGVSDFDLEATAPSDVIDWRVASGSTTAVARIQHFLPPRHIPTSAPTSVATAHSGSLQGYVRTTRDDLVRAFGEPLGSYSTAKEGGDNQPEWVLRFEDGVVATVYDFCNEATTPSTVIGWHVGGRAASVVARVQPFVPPPPPSPPYVIDYDGISWRQYELWYIEQRSTVDNAIPDAVTALDRRFAAETARLAALVPSAMNALDVAEWVQCKATFETAVRELYRQYKGCAVAYEDTDWFWHEGSGDDVLYDWYQSVVDCDWSESEPTVAAAFEQVEAAFEQVEAAFSATDSVVVTDAESFAAYQAARQAEVARIAHAYIAWSRVTSTARGNGNDPEYAATLLALYPGCP